MLQSPTNQVLIKVKTKYIANMTDLLKVSAIQNGSTIDPSDYVNIIGEVVSVPIAISDTKDYKGFSTHDIYEGDTAIFSYQVISSRIQRSHNRDPIFKNLITYKGEEFFSVNITYLFAVIRGGEIRMQNGYVMVEQMEAPKIIILDAKTKKSNAASTAVISNISKNNHSLKPMDRVYFAPNKIQLYQIGGKPFGIVKEKDILGKEIPTYQEIALLN